MRLLMVSTTMLVAALSLSGCGGDEPRNDMVELDVGDSGPKIDLEAYEKQRLDGGAVTLIDAALPDSVLLPPDHSGPTVGELKIAQREREAAARARGDAEPAEGEDEREAPRAAPAAAPASLPAPSPPPSVIRPEPVVTD